MSSLTARQAGEGATSPVPKLLSGEEVTLALSHLQGWSQQGNKLHRQYHFSSFEKAIGFLSGLALVAQATGHPVEESEIYDSVTVDLSTPELGGITDIDLELAQKADALADCVSTRRKDHEKTHHERTS